MEKNWSLIGIMLMSILLIFGPVCDAAKAGKSLPIADPRYPESLNQVISSIEDFSRAGSSVKPDIFSPDNLKVSAKFDSHPSEFAGFSLFDDPEEQEPFLGVVAINTKRRNTVASQGQFQMVPNNINYMNIDVRNIIVISINTGRGGNAIATSEIFIEPIQKGS